jgi:hypothetical protein
MDIPSTARVLHDLLAGGEPPTPLRLFVGHAISSGKYSVVGEFAEALSYYERPGRTELIQSAFQRFLLTPKDAPAPAAAAAPEQVAPQPRPEEEKARARKRKSIANMMVAMVFLAVFVTGAALAVRAFAARSGTGSLPSLKTVTEQATAQVAQIRSKIRDLAVPLGINLPGPATASVTPEAPVDDRPAPRSAARVRPAAPVAAPAPEPVAPARPAAIDPGPSPTEVARLAEPAQPAPRQEEAVAQVVEDLSIYTSESSGVSPPIPVSPRVLPSSLSLSASQAQNRMELIIGPDGSVEQVRMLTPVQRLPDVMLLSGAKSWLFRPAMKDGRPVRYRLPLTWAVSPR